jgi:hypothetical protein
MGFSAAPAAECDRSTKETTMRIAMAAVICAGLVLLTSSRAAAADAPADSPEARAKAAERYLKVVPMKGLMEDMAEQLTKNMPPEQAASVKKLLTEKLDIAAIETAAKEAMVKHFTAKQIDALATFYGSEEGREIMKKFGTYMAELQPVIQQEVRKAAAKE